MGGDGGRNRFGIGGMELMGVEWIGVVVIVEKGILVMDDFGEGLKVGLGRIGVNVLGYGGREDGGEECEEKGI